MASCSGILQLVIGVSITLGLGIQAKTIVACPRRNMYIHTKADGTESCELCTPCPKGTQKKRCSQWHGSECEICPTGSYNRRSGARCKRCTTCQPGEYTLRPCSPTEDTVCLRCPDGSFSTTKNARRCTPCTYCRQHEEMLHVCNTTSDFGCGVCKQGYFRESATGGCLPCSKCFPETYVVPECAERGGGHSGKLCMPTNRMKWVYRAEESTTVEYVMTKDGTGDPILLLQGFLTVILVLTISFILVFLFIHNSNLLKEYLRLESDKGKTQSEPDPNSTDRSIGNKMLELIKKYTHSLISALNKRKHTNTISRNDSRSTVYEIVEEREQHATSVLNIKKTQINTQEGEISPTSCSAIPNTIPRTNLEQDNGCTDTSTSTCDGTDEACVPLAHVDNSGPNDSPAQTVPNEVLTTQSMERRPKAKQGAGKKRRRDNRLNTTSTVFTNPKYFSLYNTF